MASAFKTRSKVSRLLFARLANLLTDAAAAGINLHDLTGFRILQHHHAQVRECLFARITDIDRHQIMPARGLTQCPAQWRTGVGTDSGNLKIRYQKHHRTSSRHPIGELQSLHDIGAAPHGAEEQDLAHHPQHMTPALLREECTARSDR